LPILYGGITIIAAVGPSFEVIIVVESSTDETLALAQAGTKTFPQLKVIGNRIHRGKGFAVRTGMLASAGELVIFTTPI